MILQGPENAGSKPSSSKHGPWRQQIFRLSQTSSEVLKLITPSVHQTFVIETNEVSSVLRRHLNRQEPGSAPTELCSSAFLFQLPLLWQWLKIQAPATVGIRILQAVFAFETSIQRNRFGIF